MMLENKRYYVSSFSYLWGYDLTETDVVDPLFFQLTYSNILVWLDGSSDICCWIYKFFLELDWSTQPKRGLSGGKATPMVSGIESIKI